MGQPAGLPAKRRRRSPSRDSPVAAPLDPPPELEADQLALPVLYALAAPYCPSPRLIAPPDTNSVDAAYVARHQPTPAPHRPRRGYSTVYVPDSGHPNTASKAGGRRVTPEQLLRLLHALAAFAILRPTPAPTQPVQLASLLQSDDYHLSVDWDQLERVRKVGGDQRLRVGDRLLSQLFTLPSLLRPAVSKHFGASLGGRAAIKLRGGGPHLLLAVLLAYAHDAARERGGVDVSREAAALLHVSPRLDCQNLLTWTEARRGVLEGLARQDEAQPGWLSTPAAGGRKRAPTDSPGYEPPRQKSRAAAGDAERWASHLCGREGCLHPAHLRVLSVPDNRALMVLHRAASAGVLGAVPARG